MYVESYSLINKGGYGGYQCIVVDDQGNKHSVVAMPREHSGKKMIYIAAYEALKDEAIAEKESMMEKAEKIMKGVKPPASKKTPSTFEDEPDVSHMRFFELKAYAKERGIKITKKTKKKDILAALKNV